MASTTVKALAIAGFLFAGLFPGTARGETPRDKGSIYSPVGKRDPFRQPVTESGREVSAVNPIEKWGLEKLELKAILKGIGRPRAMFEDPDGRTFILSEGDIIGRERGTVSKIINKEVIITERTFNYLGAQSLYERILSLPADDALGTSDGGGRASGSGAVPVAPARRTDSGPVPSRAEPAGGGGGDSAPAGVGPAGLNVNSSNIK